MIHRSRPFVARAVAWPILLAIGLGLVLSAVPARAQTPAAFVVIESVPPSPLQRPLFDVTRCLDLRFEVLLNDVLAGDHVVGIELRTPAGHLYQRIDVPVTTEEMRSARSRRLLGFPSPVRVQQAEKRVVDGSNRWSVDAGLSVAGTSIVSNSIYGWWTLDVHVDGHEISCEGDCRFGLYAAPGLVIFRDGFETGGTGAWSR